MEIDNRLLMIEYHLEGNHYPPIDPVYAPYALEAIENVSMGENDKHVVLPGGIFLPSFQIVDDLHLECFLDTGDE